MTNTVLVPIHGRSGVVAHARIDPVDLPAVELRRWRLNCYGYAVACLPRERHRQGSIGMHRLILAAPTDRFVDHINHDPLDNRRANLRLCTPVENSRNRKPTPGRALPKGVKFHVNRYEASIRVVGKLLYLGRFDTAAEAADAYRRAAVKHFGEFAYIERNPSWT